MVSLLHIRRLTGAARDELCSSLITIIRPGVRYQYRLMLSVIPFRLEYMVGGIKAKTLAVTQLRKCGPQIASFKCNCIENSLF